MKKRDDAMSEKKSVLIVDDTPADIAVLRDLLKDLYKTKIASNGQRALEIVTGNEPPDLILLDIMMPEMDGYVVCTELKQRSKSRELPVIFVSALNTPEDKVHAFEMGGVDYISKPFHKLEVLARVQSHLMLKQAREVLDERNKALEERNRALEENIQLREDVERITRHDLKTPLNIIIGLPDVLMDDENLYPNQREQILLIQKTGYRMLEQINRSMDIYRMEQGLYELQPQPVILEPLLGRIQVELESLARQRSVEILIQSEKNTVVMGEELLLFSLFENLIKNALEASPKVQAVTITMKKDADGSGMVRIHNHGAVPEEIRDRFFDKYATSGKRSGTGLGTYSAKLIVETHGGSISMRSSRVEGTEVTVTIPMGETKCDHKRSKAG